MNGCSNKKESYLVNNNPPNNVRESFYIKSIEILNYYSNRIETRSPYTNESNEYLLGYYASTPSESEY